MRVCLFLLLLALSATSAAAQAVKTYTGRVLPFEFIVAIRNYGVTKGGILPAQVAISVKGGTQADWLATAAYVAEKSIINDITFSQVDIFVPNPWGDKPPQGKKRLARAYYAGPDPARSPWPDQPWLIMAQGHAPTLADVEFDVLADKLVSEEPPSDDDSASDAADAKATRLLIKKYRLPQGWKPDEHLDAMDPMAVQVTGRSQIKISDSDDAEAAIEQLRDCLSRDDNSDLWRGCQDASKDYTFGP